MPWLVVYAEPWVNVLPSSQRLLSNEVFQSVRLLGC